MRTWTFLTITVALVAAACGGSEGADLPTKEPAVTGVASTEDIAPPADAVSTTTTETTTTTTGPAADPPPDVVVVAEDGDLGMVVDGNEETIDVSIRLLESDEWPVEVAGGENVPGVKIYELEPDGATFDEPVRVARRLDLARFESLGLGPKDVPMLTMLTQNDDGEFELLDDLDLLRVGDSLYVSGTTTHFSPIIISNENRMLPYLPGEEPVLPEEVIAEPTMLPPADVSDAIQRALSDGPDVVIQNEMITGEDLARVIEELVRQGVEEPPVTDPDHIPFVPLDLEGEFPDVESLLIEDPLGPPPVDGPTPDDAGYRAQRFGTSFPAVPISLAPSTATLLGDPDPELTFEMTVSVLELIQPEELDAAIEEVAADVGEAWAFPDNVDFVYEVFHRIFGVYPSSVVKRYRDLQIPEGLTAFTTTWEGSVGPEGRLVSAAQLLADGDDLVGEAGIDCFCDFLEVLVVVSNEAAEKLIAEDLSAAIAELASEPISDVELEFEDEEIEAAIALLGGSTEAGSDLDDGQVFMVGPDEGVLFDGVVDVLAVER